MAKTTKKPRASAVEKARRPAGWLTTDVDEIDRRRKRGAEEPIQVQPMESEFPVFGTFRVRSEGGLPYVVEFRSAAERINSCGCPDHRINRLGTCKHVEGVLARLAKRRGFKTAVRQGNPRVEVYLDRRDDRVRLLWPQGLAGGAPVRALLDPFFADDGSLLADPLMGVPALRRELEGAPPSLRRQVRLSAHLDPWVEAQRIRAQKAEARESFLRDVERGKRSLDIVDLPLYPYQREGALFLAFTERALLADEMGLGKTVQAIAACELLRRLRGIQRVLVISPTSLKTEWEEQIAKFTGQRSLIVRGLRRQRLQQYREPAFFYLANYEQILVDGRDIQSTLAPDVIVLDEAQRIKNWQTKTAEAVKRLASRYAFVLTGTPLENRIDEIYSIVQFLDPELLGPLFRFNRDFYVLDAGGKPIGYQNLQELHRRLRPLLLRRRKEEVEGDLPGRTVNTYFAGMEEEQAIRYQDYEELVSRLASTAKRRPLLPEEWKRLQMGLSCMRMCCDSLYILDPEHRGCPKLHELEAILGELMEDGEHKIIVFSEWTRMLELVGDLAGRMGLACAWHTGSITPDRRREEIRRFKEDPECRLFLATDSGGVGLNLQVADVVINCDIPWNPARLEQRIARAWRKHQTRPVQVINLVCQGSIEHRIVGVLEHKRSLAEGVVDGAGELDKMPTPSTSREYLERVATLMAIDPPPPVEPGAEPVPPKERIKQDVVARLSDRLELLQITRPGDGRSSVLAVVDRADDASGEVVGEAVHRHQPEAAVEVIDRATFDTIQRLVKAGVLAMPGGEAEILHGAAARPDRDREQRERRRREARQALAQSERSRRMAKLLAEGGFVQESLAPVAEAVEQTLKALAAWLGEPARGPVAAELIGSRMLAEGLVPAGAPELVGSLRDGGVEGEDAARRRYRDAERLMDHAGHVLQGAGALE